MKRYFFILLFQYTKLSVILGVFVNSTLQVAKCFTNTGKIKSFIFEFVNLKGLQVLKVSSFRLKFVLTL